MMGKSLSESRNVCVMRVTGNLSSYSLSLVASRKFFFHTNWGGGSFSFFFGFAGTTRATNKKRGQKIDSRL